MGRKRPRWDQDHDLEVNVDSGRRRIEVWDDRRRDRHHYHHHDRHHHHEQIHHHRRDSTFEQVPQDTSFATASASSTMVSRFGFTPTRGGGGGGEGDAPPFFERRRRTPPSFRPAVPHSYPDAEVFEDNVSLDEYDYRENYFAGNRGKRIHNEGYNEEFMGTPTKHKPSVLSRIQHGKSVWERIEERPSFVSSPSPPPPVPPPTLPPSSSLVEHQLETDAIDLSFKSDALVVKVVASPRTIAPCSDVKAPAALNPIARKKVIKKKVIKKRTRVVVPIVTTSKEPTLTEGAVKAPVSTRPHKVPGQVETSPEAIVSSGTTASTATQQSRLKLVVKVASVGKSVAKKSAKKVVLIEGGVIDDAQGEDKAAAVNGESRKYAEELLNEFMRSTDGAISQLCQEGSSAMSMTTNKSAEEQSGGTCKLEGRGDIKDIREEECVIPGGRASPNRADPICSISGVGDGAHSHISAQAGTVDLALHGNSAAEGSYKSVENEITADPGKQSLQTVEDVANAAGSDNGLSTPPPSKESPISLSGDEARVAMSVGFVSVSSSGDSLEGKRGKRKREEEEKRQQLAISKVTEGLDVFGGRQSELGDPCFVSNMIGIPDVLKSGVKDADLDRTVVDGPKEDENHDINLQVRDELESDFIRLGQDHIEVPMIDSMCERMEKPSSFRHSKLDSLAVVSKVQDLLHLTSAGQSHAQLSDSKGIDNECYNNNQDDLPSKRLFASEEKESMQSNKSIPDHLPFIGKVQPKKQLNQPKKQLNVNIKVADEVAVRKTNSSSGIPRVVPSRVDLAGSAKDTARSSHSVKSKTWHRNNTPPASASHRNLQGPGGSSMHKQSPKKLNRPQSSYIRKGNSLIRKSPPEVHPPKQPHDLGVSSRISRQATKRSTGIQIKVDRTDYATGSNMPFERPKTPPLPLGTKPTNCTMDPLIEFSRPMLEDPNPERDGGTRIGQLENQAVDLVSGTTDNPNTIVCRKSESSKTKRMTYVKRKSNQLVAAPRPDSGDSCAHPTDNTQSLASFTSSDLYYRRKKNQLVRNASTSDLQQKQNAVNSLDNSNSDDQRASTVSSIKSSKTTLFMKRLDKVRQKTYKHPKFSLVWMLGGEKSHKKDLTSSNCWKVLPHLFPWKRTIYRRNSITNTVTMPNRRSSSILSRKLQHTRKRNTIYKVSTDGFSLRKAGVVSIGGASLKWSKSIEKHSKKASKEATLAVAEAERKKRERKRTTSVGAKGKNGKCLPRERIFRVGSARYKMDSSKRTLIRIPDEQSSSVVDLQSGNNIHTSFVPRRLLIGNDEYVRVGNGNQLVRDPKKLTRILASEKVRWSLHTARLRLARKQQYCQFFTRYGQCNKNDGKCPYIHDPAKVAICTKFLRGLCSSTNCKLTHKVLPERMPDCSYFLQGLCTNINCPYRHVNVNPNASVCEGFLKGYCADGDECRKKHSYVCPLFKATGKCPQGSKCKLHHPKNRIKSKKKKQAKVQSNSWGRYFGRSVVEVGEPLRVTSDKHGVEKAGDEYFDGHFTDYISLDSGSDDNVEADVPVDSQQAKWDFDISEMQPKDLDALIKPVEADVPVDSQQAKWDFDISEMQPKDLDALIKPVRIMKKANSEYPFGGS